MEKKMENEMETGGIEGFKELRVQPRWCLHSFHQLKLRRLSLELQKHARDLCHEDKARGNISLTWFLAFALSWPQTICTTLGASWLLFVAHLSSSCGERHTVAVVLANTEPKDSM